MQEEIRRAPTPKAAKNIANNIELRKDWDDIKDAVIMVALMAKVKQHPSIKQKLLEIGNIEIIEDNQYDYYWGRGKDDTGKNKLGKMWMLIRDSIRLN